MFFNTEVLAWRCMLLLVNLMGRHDSLCQSAEKADRDACYMVTVQTNEKRREEGGGGVAEAYMSRDQTCMVAFPATSAT